MRIRIFAYTSALFIMIFAIVAVYAGENRDDIRRNRLSLDEARELFAKDLGERIEISEKITPDIWEKMKAQVFMVRDTNSLSPWVFYLLDSGEKYRISAGFNSAIDLIVTDMDKNGYYELFFAYNEVNSSGKFGCYTEGFFLPFSGKLTRPDLKAVFRYVLVKTGDTYTVEIHEGKKVITSGKLFIKKYINGRREVSVY